MSKKQFTFHWQGRDQYGHSQQGEMSATNEAAVRIALRAQKITPTDVSKAPQSWLVDLGLTWRTGSNNAAVWLRQLATLIGAGIPVVQAFELTALGVSNARFQCALKQVAKRIESGQSVAKSLAQQPMYFDSLICGLVHIGEQSGTLDALLNHGAAYLEKKQQLKSRLVQALTYPAVVLSVGLALALFLLLAVVPGFESLFDEMGVPLPLLTQQVLSISRFLAENGVWLIAFWLFVALLLFVWNKRSDAPRQAWAHLQLRLPVYGTLFKRVLWARLARVLSITVAAGIPVADALGLVSDGIGQLRYQQALQDAKQRVLGGQALNVSLAFCDLFPDLWLQMIKVGEESGALDTMLAKIADYYEQEAHTQLAQLSSLVEPLLMLALGVVLGGLILAMYLPIFEMGTLI